jgi:Protein of unknown function (DUF3277)
MALLATYDPASIILTVIGNVITGFAEDSAVKVERTAELYQLKVGQQGDAARSRSRDRSGKITFKLLATSPSNDILSALVEADQVGIGVGPSSVTDVLSPGTLVHAPRSWVSKLPDYEAGKEVAEREWVVSSDNIEMALGGNPA